MNLMRWIATRWIPPGAKASSTYRMYLAFLQSLIDGKDLEEDDEFRRDLERTTAKFGEWLALDMRDMFSLGDSIADAVDAWKIGCLASGIKIRVEKEGGKYTFHHLFCPMHQYFTKQGIIPCSTLCLPVVAKIAETICPSCDVEIIRGGDLESTCIKAIKPKGGNVSLKGESP